MPNDLGPSTWLEAQYVDFLRGIEELGTGEAKRLARARPEIQLDPAKQPRISIPHWDDVIRTGPRVPVTEQDYAVYKHFKRAGLEPPLSPEVQGSIEQRRAIADRIRHSAIPEYQRGVGTIMTAIDNVQDAALTISVLGTITVTALGRFGNYIAPAVASLATVARMLGWLGIAAGILGVAYALACQGPRDALSQARSTALAGFMFKGVRAIMPRARGVPSPFPAAGAKGQEGMAMFSTPKGRVAANHRKSRWARALPTFGESLQMAQTAKDLTGYGLALGAIIGFSSETAYAAARASLGERVTVRSPAAAHALALVLRSTLARYGKGALWHRHQCARALAAAPFILRDPETFGDAMYGLTWIAFYACLEPLMTDTHGLAWREPMIDTLETATFAPWDIADEITRDHLEELGEDIHNLRWPLPGSPAEVSAERLLLEVGPQIGDELEKWLEAAPFDPWRRFIAEMAMHVCERVWYWLEGSNDWPTWKLSPTTAVWESMWLGARFPVISDPADRIIAAWAASEEWCRVEERQIVPVEVLDRIWLEHGAPLLRLRAGPSAADPEFFVPYDQETGTPADAAFGSNLAEARRRLTDLLAEGMREPD